MSGNHVRVTIDQAQFVSHVRAAQREHAIHLNPNFDTLNTELAIMGITLMTAMGAKL